MGDNFKLDFFVCIQKIVLCSELQNDYNKYGYDDFVFECIEQTNNFLLEKEKNYQINEGIDIFKIEDIV